METEWAITSVVLKIVQRLYTHENMRKRERSETVSLKVREKSQQQQASFFTGNCLKEQMRTKFNVC